MHGSSGTPTTPERLPCAAPRHAQGGLATSGAPTVVNPFAGLGGAAASPTSFRAALAKLSACLVLSATGNALVSFFSTLLGERFAHRLKGQLMQVGAGGCLAARPCTLPLLPQPLHAPLWRRMLG